MGEAGPTPRAVGVLDQPAPGEPGEAQTRPARDQDDTQEQSGDGEMCGVAHFPEFLNAALLHLGQHAFHRPIRGQHRDLQLRGGRGIRDLDSETAEDVKSHLQRRFLFAPGMVHVAPDLVGRHRVEKLANLGEQHAGKLLRGGEVP